MSKDYHTALNRLNARLFVVCAIGQRMPDQIIDAIMARSIQVDAAKAHALSAWIVQHDPPEVVEIWFLATA